MANSKLSNSTGTISWEEIKNKPEHFIPTEHTHNVTWDDVIGKPNEYTPEYHTHDEYSKRYHKHTIADIIGLEGQAYELDGTHNHDDRHYTQNQISAKLDSLQRQTQTLLDSKSDLNHTHNIEDLEGLENITDCYKQYRILADMLVEDDDGFYTCTLIHNLNTTSLNVIVKDINQKELLVDVTILNERSICLLTDSKEVLFVLLKKLNVN